MKIKIGDFEFFNKLYKVLQDFKIEIQVLKYPNNDYCIRIVNSQWWIDIPFVKCEKIDNCIIFDINEFIEKVEKTGLVEITFNLDKIVIRPAVQIKVEVVK